MFQIKRLFKEILTQNTVDSQNLSEYVYDILLVPGDIILTRKKNTIFAFFRDLIELEYDHVAVLVRDNQVIQISCPHVRIKPVQQYLQKAKEPMILRPVLTLEQKRKFVDSLLDTLGQKYDVKAIGQSIAFYLLNKISSRKFASNLAYQQLPTRNTCSDLIMQKLTIVNPQLLKILSLLPSTKFQLSHHILPDDFLELARMQQNSPFEVILTTPINKIPTYAFLNILRNVTLRRAAIFLVEILLGSKLIALTRLLQLTDNEGLMHLMILSGIVRKVREGAVKQALKRLVTYLIKF